MLGQLAILQIWTAEQNLSMQIYLKTFMKIFRIFKIWLTQIFEIENMWILLC